MIDWLVLTCMHCDVCRAAMSVVVEGFGEEALRRASCMQHVA